MSIDYRLIRSSRKSISVEITDQAEILVRAPKRMSRTAIEAFLSAHLVWIEQHLFERRQELQKRALFSVADLKEMPFCGKMLTVCSAEDGKVRINLLKECIYLPDQSVIELVPQVRRAYEAAARAWLVSRVEAWAGEMQLHPAKVSFSPAVRRWGSCSANGNLHFSWLLLFAPVEAMDYVIVHELAHLRYFDHSEAFWALVAVYMPDYREQKQTLRKLSSDLSVQGWNIR